MRVIRGKDYASFFQEETGAYLRTGILKGGAETEEDPFQGDFPELLDIGIMGHCLHGRSGLCLVAGVECYQNGLTADKPNMPLEDFERIAEQCRGRTFQIALGGCGDPNQHESFEGILKACHKNRIVPNFTTSGLGLTAQKAKLCKKYCGAVAVSWYRSKYTLDAISLLLAQGVKTNVHYVLSRDSLGEALSRLRADAEQRIAEERGDGHMAHAESGADAGFPRGINAVVFLLHKPVGQGSFEQMVTLQNQEFAELFHFLDSEEAGRLPYKIGFDSCSVPALIRTSHVDPNSLDTCEGARWSAYISSDLRMMPCSFAHDRQEWSVSLREHSILEAWQSEPFERFRERLRTACAHCGKRQLCMGGCPLMPDIVLCSDKT